MTYTGAMVLPSNAVCMNTNEMRYVDGGSSWSNKFMFGKGNWSLSLKNVAPLIADFFSLYLSISAIKSGLKLLAAGAAHPTLTVMGAASVMVGIPGAWMSLKSIKDHLSVKKVN